MNVYFFVTVIMQGSMKCIARILHTMISCEDLSDETIACKCTNEALQIACPLKVYFEGLQRNSKFVEGLNGFQNSFQSSLNFEIS